MNTKLVIYPEYYLSRDALDALASAWILYQFLENNADYLGWYFDDSILPNVTNYNQIFIIDCAFSEEILEKWADRGKSIVVIDHHIKTFHNLSIVNKSIKQIFDINECSAILTWKTLFGKYEKMPAFLLYIKDIDLENNELAHTEIVDTAISILLLRLEQFGEVRLKMIFTLFDYLATLSESELLEYLCLATGLTYL